MFQTNYVGGQPQFPVKDTIFTDISITNSKKSGDAFDAKSGFGIWATSSPSPVRDRPSVRPPSSTCG